MSFVHSPKIVTDGLVLSLDAGNVKSYPGLGTTWFDKSGRGNNGTLVNGPTFSSGSLGSIVFDGVDDYATFSNNLSISQNNPFTVEFWVNLSSYTNLYPCLIQIKTDTTYSFIVMATQNPTYSGINFGSTNTWINLRNSGNQLSINTWYQIVVTYNGNGSGNSSNYKMYLNSVEQTLTSSGGYINLSQINNIGTAENASRGFDNWTGKISSVRIYNKALSAQEITQNFNALRGRFGI
jgi:hypothetical protein